LAALAGAPPSIGFAARLLIFGAAFTHSWPTAVLALAASALWLYAALRAIVMVAVLPPRSRAPAVSRTSLALAWAPAVLGLSAGLQPARLARWLFGVGA
jgi:NADH:ubiquinone oxidoreductase subunit 2 (subunit N)